MAEAAAAAPSSIASSLDVAGSVVQMGTAIANTIAGINDMNKRRHFEEALALLSNQQQKELNDKLLKANTDTERLSILSENVVQYAIANENGVAKKDTVMYIIAGSLAAIILVSSIVYAIKRKK